jgi:hypothetical protein
MHFIVYDVCIMHADICSGHRRMEDVQHVFQEVGFPFRASC